MLKETLLEGPSGLWRRSEEGLPHFSTELLQLWDLWSFLHVQATLRPFEIKVCLRWSLVNSLVGFGSSPNHDSSTSVLGRGSFFWSLCETCSYGVQMTHLSKEYYRCSANVFLESRSFLLTVKLVQSLCDYVETRTVASAETQSAEDLWRPGLGTVGVVFNVLRLETIFWTVECLISNCFQIFENLSSDS